MQDLVTLEALRNTLETSFRLVECGERDASISFEGQDGTVAGTGIMLTGMYNTDNLVALELLTYGLAQLQSYYDRNFPSSEFERSGWNMCLCRVPPDNQVALNVRLRVSQKVK